MVVLVLGPNGDVVLNATLRANQGSFGTHDRVIAQPLVLALASPLRACSSVAAVPKGLGPVLLVAQRGDCTFSTKVRFTSTVLSHPHVWHITHINTYIY